MGNQHAAPTQNTSARGDGWSLNDSSAHSTYLANNTYRGYDEVDLHGLTVAHAKKYAKLAIQAAKERNYRKMIFIVGRGKHSPNGIPRLKPAIHQYAMELGYKCELDMPNEGCITVFVQQEEPNTVIVVILVAILFFVKLFSPK